MSTPANALDITQAGLVKFDGVSVFTGVTITNHDVLVGAASNGVTSVSPSTSGKFLMSNGVASDPSFETISNSNLPGSGTITLTDGTNITVTGSPVALGAAATIAVSGPPSATTLTNHGVVLGQGASAVTATSAGTSGQLLQSKGAALDPTWTTATYPSTAGTAGFVVTSDGTNFVSSAPASSGTVTSVSGTTDRITVVNGTTTPVIDIAATYVGQTSITTLGTVTTGTWNGIAITVPYGGTGANTLTNHGVLFGQGTSAIVASAAGSAGQVLQSGGASADPSYSTPTYPSASGAAGKILRSNGTNNVYSTATFPDTAGSVGNILTSDGTNWYSATPMGVGQLTYFSRVLTSLEVKNLHGTPISLIAAPGAGKALCLVSPIYAKLFYGGTNAFTAGGGGAISLYYGTAAEAVDPAVVSGTTLSLTASAYQITGVTASSVVQITNIASIENLPIQAYNASVTEIGGNAANNNTVTLSFYYYTVTI